MKRLLALATLLLAAACASSGDDDRPSALLSSATEHGSTTDLSVAIDQTNQPILIGTQSRTDFRYAIEVRNHTSAPVTLTRVSLQSTGSAPVRIPVTTRTFDRAIAPGTSERVEFWAPAEVTDFSRGNRLPLTVRIRTTTRDAEDRTRTDAFLRRVTAEYVTDLAQ